MIIDSHQHFWKYNPVRDSWIDETMEVIRKDFLPENLHPILKANQVDGCIAVQADQSETETEFLLNCAKNYPFIKGVVGWVDLCAPNVESRLQYFAKNPLFKGVRHIAQAEADDFLLRPDLQHGISKLEELNLTFDILVFQKQLPSAISLVKQFPNQKFVLDHIAKPKLSQAIDINWEKNIQALAAHKNVFCKVSGLVTETTNFKWSQNDFIPFLDVVNNAFGTDRLLFGSDWPVCLLAAEYKQTIEIISTYFKAHSPKAIINVFGANAIAFYDL